MPRQVRRLNCALGAFHPRFRRHDLVLGTSERMVGFSSMVKCGVTGDVVVHLSRAFEFRGRCASMARLRRCHCSRREHSRSRRTARVVIGRISLVQLIVRGSDRQSESCTFIILVSNQSSNADGNRLGRQEKEIR